MRICFDISAGLGQGAGIGRYVRQLALALNALPGGPALRLFHNRQPLERLPPALARLARWQAPLGNKTWRFYLLSGLPLLPRWRTTIDDSDLFHGTDAVTPRLCLPTVITIHDLTTMLFPRHHSRLNRLYMRWALPLMTQRADAVITDAHASQNDIVTLLGVAPEKVSVVHLGVDNRHFTSQSPVAIRTTIANLGIRSPYLLAVGTLEPRKNLITLLHAYAMLPPPAPELVLVGGQGWGNEQLANVIRQLGLTGRVRLAGYMADETLPALYSGAEIFVYPSLYEGFGLPVLEAMACGAPVITSNVSSLPEVAGEAAIQVNPRSANDLAAAIQTLLDSPDKRRTMRQAGIVRARSFSWERCAQETLGVYQRVLESTT